jgi:hypothetical protein
VMQSASRYRKGDELGWFEQGSTIILLAPKILSSCRTFIPDIQSAWAKH